MNPFPGYPVLIRFGRSPVFSPCSVVIEELTEESEVITVGGLKHENNTLGIRWYWSNPSITTSFHFTNFIFIRADTTHFTNF